MLNSIYNSCYDEASQLKGWQKLDKNEIANLYLDNRNSENSSIYASALLCAYWYKVGIIWENNKSAMTQEDCYETVWDGIERAISFAPWRNKDNELYGDPNGPDKAINVCIETIRKNYYNYSSRDKRKVNHRSNIQSLDAMFEHTKDYSNQMYEDYEELTSDDSSKNLNVDLYIKDLIEHDNLPEAILIDNICYNDSLIEDNGEIMFSKKKFIIALHSLGETFVDRFSDIYGVDREEVKNCVITINSLSGFKFNKLLSKTLYCAKVYGGFGCF